MENESAKQVVSRLVKENIEMITACFDEYYFFIPEGVIRPVPENARKYFVGDPLPVKGKTYQFPDDMNIIDLHFGLVARIKEAKLYDVIPLKDYEYDFLPALNMMGFAIKLSSQGELEEFKRHYTTFKLSEREKLAFFANKWFDITKYRSIRYL